MRDNDSEADFHKDHVETIERVRAYGVEIRRTYLTEVSSLVRR